MPKETYDTDVKRKVIEKQAFLIKRNLIQKAKKDPKDLRVAFFPGAEALEYKVAYEPLGIPQENITAIERYKPNFKYWKKNSQFNMTDKPIEAIDFFKNYQGEPFDVISLDYDGMFGEETIQTFLGIIGKQLLNHKSIFVSNLYAKREGKKTKEWYNIVLAAKAAGQFITKDSQMDERMLRSIKNSSGMKKNFLGTNQENICAKELIDQIGENLNLDYKRDRGILDLFAITFASGKNYASRALPALYFKDPFHENWETQIQEFIKKMPKDEIERCMIHFILIISKKALFQTL